jgi:hypothetical protein
VKILLRDNASRGNREQERGSGVLDGQPARRASIFFSFV